MYQSLYRKYRPETFDRIVGQHSIITILKNSISKNKISHAYLFSGPRGTGKTSTAKILAKTVNCLDLKDGISCEKCDNCRSINNGTAVDIIEIDAASNNGVDEIRELRNNINLACAALKYKVYIIDEVHMLSIGAFNALLKTLEEPPEHAIFILATTDPQKVPTTIVSRCQCYQFKQISIQNIVENLKYICKNEKLKVSDEVLEKIAIFSNGGMRDAIGLLEKVSLYGNNITIDEFNDLCGFVTSEDVENIINSIVSGDLENTVSIIDEKYKNGINLVTFFGQCIDLLRSKVFENIKDKSLTSKYAETIILLNDVINEIKISTNPRGVAVAMIGKSILTCTPVEKVEIKEQTETKEVKKEEKNEKQEAIKQPENKEPPKKLEEEKDDELYKIIINNTFATASKQKLSDLQKEWQKLNDYVLDSDYGSNVSFLLDGKICAVGDKNFIYAFRYSSLVNRANDMYDTLISTLKKLLKIDCRIAFMTDDDWEKEKKEFIEKKKNGETYKWIEAENIKPKKQKEKGIDANTIFGEEIVEYE